MKHITLLTAWLLFGIHAIAQTTFQQFYGTPNTSEITFGAVETKSGEIMMLNRVHNPNTGTYDMQLMLLDEMGEQIWVKTYETPENEEELDILKLASENYLLTAKLQNGDNPILTKINTEGEIIWINSSLLQNRKLVDMMIGNNGEIVCLAKEQNYRIVVVDENQEIVWETPIEDTQVSISELNSIAPTQNGGYVLSGAGNTDNSEKQLMLLYKVDNEGNKEWFNLFGHEHLSGNPVSEYAIETSDGGYFLLGRTNNGWIYRIVYKVNSEGLIIWTESEVSARPTGTYKAVENSSGGFTTLIGQNAELSLYSAEGDVEWRKYFYRGYDASLLGFMSLNSNSGGIAFGSVNGLNGSGKDTYLIRYNAEGDTTWTKSYGEFGNRDRDEVRAIAYTADSHLLTFGLTENTPLNGSQWFLSAVDADNGELIWEKHFGEETITGMSILPIEENNFLLSGLVTVNNQLTTRLLKINAEGNSLWQKDYPNTFPDKTPTLVQTTEQDFVVLVNGIQQYRLIKTSKEGDFLWERELNENEFYTSITSLSDGSFILTGTGQGEFGDNGFYKPMMVAKFDTEGFLEWKKNIIDEDADFSSGVAYRAVENEVGNIVVVGVNFFGSNTKAKIHLSSFNKQGDVLWKQNLTELMEINLSVFDLLQTHTGDWIVMGNTSENETEATNFQKGFLIKADATGHPLWIQYYGEEISSYSILSDMIEMPEGGFALTGTILYQNSLDSYVVKTDTEGLITSITPLQKPQFDFNILPNPNQGIFEMSFAENTNQDKELTLNIFDYTGKTFSKQKIHPLSKKLDLSYLPKGIYFMQISDGIQFEVKRFVIN